VTRQSNLIVGVDLGALDRKSTGVCVLSNKLELKLLTLTEPNFVRSFIPGQSLVVLDAPLSLPTSGYLRIIEIQARKLGINLLPPLLGGMAKLTEAGTLLKQVLEAKDCKLLESHPTSIYKLIGTNREELWHHYAVRRGVKAENVSVHEMDAFACALIGVLFNDSMACVIEDPTGVVFVYPPSNVSLAAIVELF